MGTKERQRKQASRQARAYGTPTALSLTPEMRQIFLGEDGVPLTAETIRELVEKNGWPEKDLLEFQAQGARYSQPRNSIIFPAETDL